MCNLFLWGFFGIDRRWWKWGIVIKELVLSISNPCFELRQEKFARDNDIPIENWYQEKASGAKNDRIELNRLLSILKENDELYVIDASRLWLGAWSFYWKY